MDELQTRGFGGESYRCFFFAFAVEGEHKGWSHILIPEQNTKISVYAYALVCVCVCVRIIWKNT